MARTFRDKNGKKWRIEITVADVKKVRDEYDIDLSDLLADEAAGLVQLMHDQVKTIDIIYLLCESQCDERNMTDEQFGRSFDGEAVEKATFAFYQAFADFCPRHQREPLLHMVAVMERELAKAAGELTSTISDYSWAESSE